MRQCRCRVEKGAPAAADLGGELVAADGVLRAVVGGRDVEASGEQPDLGGFAFEPPGEDDPTVPTALQDWA
jgi:hypothetical protein